MTTGGRSSVVTRCASLRVLRKSNSPTPAPLSAPARYTSKMVTRTLLLASVLAAISCKGSPKDAPPTITKEKDGNAAPSPMGKKSSPKADVTKKPKSLDALTVTVDGTPKAMTKAFIKPQPDGTFQLFVSEKNGSCDELLISSFNGTEGSVDVLVQIVTLLAADGSETRIVKDVYLGPPTEADAGSKAKVHGNADKGTDVDVDLDFTSQAGSGAKLAIHGSLTAEGCGPRDTSKGPGIGKVTHPSTAKMTIGGKTFDVKGAIKQGDYLELTDFPRDCTVGWFIGVRVAVEHGNWLLNGTRIAELSEGKATGLKIVAGKKGDGDDGKTVELTASGAGTIGAYGVKLEGVVEALECGN